MTATFIERLHRASLGPRVLTAMVGIPLVSLVLWAGGVWWAGLTGAIALLGWLEFVHLHALGTARRLVVLAVMIGVFAVMTWGDDWQVDLLLLVWALVIASAVISVVWRRLNAAMLGPVYLGAPMALLARWRSELTPWSILAFLLVIWANDTAAYFVGLAAGRHKMAPRISPGKSWEGAAAGAAAGGLAGGLTASMLGVTPGEAVLFGLLTTIASQIGDLFESAMKRKAGLKDSGAFLPGHGGILDRFDGILIAAPIAYVLVRLWSTSP